MSNAIANNIKLVIESEDPNIFCELNPENDHRNIFCTQDFSHGTTNCYKISKEQQNRQTAIASIIIKNRNLRTWSERLIYDEWSMMKV